MGENSKIEWTTHTFNPWMGCTKVAPGCTHCYAEAFTKRYGKANWGPEGTRVRTSDANWRKPLKWNREAQCNCGAAGSGDRECAFCAGGCERPRVFCASLADVFEDWIGDVHDSNGQLMFLCKCGLIDATDGDPCERCGDDQGLRLATLDDLRHDLFALIDATPNLDWLLLTKRPENVLRMWPANPHWTLGSGSSGKELRHRPNVWLLTSIATQADADKNIPELLKCRDLVPVLGVSAEPLVGPVGLNRFIYTRFDTNDGIYPSCKLDWVIVGGESGHGARPFDIGWGRSIIEQCKAAAVPCFVKQLGAKPGYRNKHPFDGWNDLYSNGERLKDKKGGDISEWPEDLRVREFPRTAAVS